MLRGRNYHSNLLPPQYKEKDISDAYSYSQSVYDMGYKAQRSIVTTADRLIDEIVCEDFVLYIPNFCVPIFVAFYTNNHCKEARYIQEGGFTQKKVFRTNYSWYRIAKDILRDVVNKRPLRLWMPCSVYTSKHLYKNKELHSYALTERYFRNLPSQHHVIEWPSFKIDIDLHQDWPIFITDGYIRNKMSEKDIYYNLLRKLIKQYSKANNYIKFHPAQPETERIDILGFFYDIGLNCEIIPDSIPIEIVIINLKKLTFVGMGSSLLYFAQDNGHQVISHDDWILEKSELYKKYYKNTGAFLFKDYYK